MTTLTRALIVEKVFTEVGLSQNESAALSEMALERMAGALEAGETLKISAFATFTIRQKGQRIGRNPKTGVEVPIAPRRGVSPEPCAEGPRQPHGAGWGRRGRVAGIC